MYRANQLMRASTSHRVNIPFTSFRLISCTMKILLIEDDADIVSNIGQYFEDKGYQLNFAYNGAHGLAMALAERFDLIILDLMLPGKDGITLCREFCQQSAHDTPILMLTARDTLDDKIFGFEAGADDYLVKPFSLRELEVRVLALVRRDQGSKNSAVIEDRRSRVEPGHHAGKPRRPADQIETESHSYSYLPDATCGPGHFTLGTDRPHLVRGPAGRRPLAGTHPQPAAGNR